MAYRDCLDDEIPPTDLPATPPTKPFTMCCVFPDTVLGVSITPTFCLCDVTDKCNNQTLSSVPSNLPNCCDIIHNMTSGSTALRKTVIKASRVARAGIQSRKIVKSFESVKSPDPLDPCPLLPYSSTKRSPGKPTNTQTIIRKSTTPAHGATTRKNNPTKPITKKTSPVQPITKSTLTVTKQQPTKQQSKTSAVPMPTKSKPMSTSTNKGPMTNAMYTVCIVALYCVIFGALLL